MENKHIEIFSSLKIKQKKIKDFFYSPFFSCNFPEGEKPGRKLFPFA